VSETPDLTCDDEGCPVREKMNRIADRLVPPPEDESTALIAAFLDTYASVRRERPERAALDIGVALPALFDLVVSGHYAAALSEPTWTYCAGREDEPPVAYSPFLKATSTPRDLTTCPRCAGRHDQEVVVASNKPESDNIGVDSESATTLLLAEIIDRIGSEADIYNSTNRRGDVDVVVDAEDTTVLAELKSSPLFPLPLSVRWADLPHTTEPEDHTPVTGPEPDLADLDLAFSLPHTGRRIAVGPRTDDDWPFPQLRERFCDPDTVTAYLTAWNEVYEVYAANAGLRGEREPRRWLYAGCGGDTSDSKQKPGLDRTDDIKKGTYQVVKYTTTYKDRCSGDHIRSALVSNFYPTRQYEDYYEDMADLKLVKPEHQMSDQDDGLRSFPAENVYNMYDAILCLTDALYNDDRLRELAGPERLEATLVSGDANHQS
jgi:hypothetical protein